MQRNVLKYAKFPPGSNLFNQIVYVPNNFLYKFQKIDHKRDGTINLIYMNIIGFNFVHFWITLAIREKNYCLHFYPPPTNKLIVNSLKKKLLLSII